MLSGRDQYQPQYKREDRDADGGLAVEVLVLLPPPVQNKTGRALVADLS